VREHPIQGVWLRCGQGSAWREILTKLLVSYREARERDSGLWHVLWTVFCWVTAFSAVIVTAAVMMR